MLLQLYSKFLFYACPIIFLIWLFPAHALENLISNGSFEKGLKGWKLDKQANVHPKNNRLITFEMDKKYIQTPFEFDYYPKTVKGKLAKSIIYFEFYDQEGKNVSRLTYVLSGSGDHWFHQNKKYGDFAYLTYVISTRVGKWNQIRFENILNDHNKKALEIGSKPLSIEEISKIQYNIYSWAIRGGIVDVFYKNLPKWLHYPEFDSVIVQKKDCLQRDRSCIDAFHFLPSDAHHFLRIYNVKHKLNQQIVKNLNSQQRYLFLFDAKNEIGLIPPVASVLNTDNAVLAKKTILMQMAQTGWVTSGFVFSPPNSSVIVKLGETSNEGFEYSNNYDNIRLYALPEMTDVQTKRFVQKHFALTLSDTHIIQENPIDYRTAAGEEYFTFLEKELDKLDVPVYNVSFDEYKFWMTGKQTEPYWGYRIRNKYKTRPSAKLNINGIVRDVKMKTRGTMSYHHASRLKSLRIDLKKNTRIDFLRPCTRTYLGEAFSYELAKYMGLLSIRNEFIYLTINHKPIGIYWQITRDKADLELQRKPQGYLIGLKRGGRYLFDYFDEHWKLYANLEEKRYKRKYPPGKLVNDIFSFLKNNNIQAAREFIDVEQLLKWNAHSFLLGSTHQDPSHNIMLYWDSSRGILEIMPWDVRFGMSSDLGVPDIEKPFMENSLFFIHYNPVADVFLNNFLNYNRRNRILWQYVKNTDLLVNAKRTFDSLYEQTKPGFQRTRDFECPHNPSFTLDIVPYSTIDAMILKIWNVFQLRFKRLRQYLAFNNHFDLEITRFQTEPNSEYEHLRLNIAPVKNNFISSTQVEKIVLKNHQRLKDVKLVDLHSGQKWHIDIRENGVIPIHRHLVSDAFLSFKIIALWRDQYNRILTKLHNDPDAISFLKNQYGELQPKQRIYNIKKKSLDDVAIRNRIISILRTSGEIIEKQRLTLELTFKRIPGIDVKNDISVILKNAVTDAQIPFDNVVYHEVANKPKHLNIQPATVRFEQAENKKIEVAQEHSVFDSPDAINRTRAEFLMLHSYFKPLDSAGQIMMPEGEYAIRENIIIPKNMELIIAPGAVLRFGPDVSLISYGKIRAVGTQEKPIIFTSMTKTKSWGVVGLLRENAFGEFEHCIFERGGEAYINGVYFSGMLAAHYSDINVENSKFQYASVKNGDDAINIKYGLAKIEHSFFYRNGKDAIDLDFAKKGSAIEKNYFLNNGNDSVDISGSNVIIRDNIIEGSKDKGISIGEESKILIVNNIIKRNQIGIVAKDLSYVTIENNNFLSNTIGIAAYNKKMIFGGGHVSVYNSLFQNNGTDIGVEIIPENDNVRTQEKKYKSDIVVYNSKCRFSNSVRKIVVREPKKKKRGKKALIKAYLEDSLADYGYKFALLSTNGKISALKEDDFSFKELPVGLLNSPLSESEIPFYK